MAEYRNGSIYSNGKTIGIVKKDGSIYSGGKTIGIVKKDGSIYSGGRTVGKVKDCTIKGMEKEPEAVMVAAYHFLVKQIF